MTLAPHSKSGFEKLRLPDFLGIGALKAATTYLDALLRAHPQLCLPPGLKEVQFFNRYYDRGVEWYAGLFSSCDGRRRGEISPQYLFDESCPARIASVLPDVRLLVSIRDPVQRAYSQYKHWVEERGYREPFETFLADHPGALARGEYFRSVCRYLDYFPFEHIHVLLAEELVSRPAPVLAEIFQFLDVDPALAPAPAERAQNVSTVPRFHRLYVVTKRVTRWLYGRGGAQVVYTAKRLGLPRLFHDGSVRGTFPPLAPDTAERLRAHYSADVAGLSQLLGRDLSTYWWRLDNPAYQE
ncbi:MAG TPA: sulfotransferase domain-containing protein [Acidimicrobiales bacterium]|nr:sulfotransferase domain-containing protein [Acidimicrobiales bacterium]